MQEALSLGGIFDLSTFSTVTISGPDASDYLHRMSTVDFRTWQPGEVRMGAFLTGRGQVISMGFFTGGGDSFDFVVSPPQGPVVLEHIEKFHFAERFTVIDSSPTLAWMGVWDPTKRLRSALRLAEQPPLRMAKLAGEGISADFWREERRSDFFWIRMNRQFSVEWLRGVTSGGVALLEAKLNRFLEIEAGIPRVGVEISDKEIVLEANFDEAVARNKGCYPGQEVVERIFTYGQVNKKLFRVACAGEKMPEAPFEITLGDTAAGKVVSLEPVPGKTSEGFGLAYLGKKFWDATEPFQGPGVTVLIRR